MKEKSKIKYYKLIIVIALAAVFASGCATQSRYFTLDSSLQKDIKSFGGVEYVPLEKLCDKYGLEYSWDGFIKTATIEKGSSRVVLRPDSYNILLDDKIRKIERPAILSGGTIFVPVSLVKNNLGRMMGSVAVEKEIIEKEAPKKYTIRTVVIDPGHGGKDPGAIGRRLRVKEKEKTLYLARRIRDELQSSGLRVVMTRADDRFIPLSRRAEIANFSGADLFISVHLNSSRSRSLRGFECYFLSNATDDNALALAAFENASLKLNDTASLERSNQLDKTLWDMTLTENRLESAELAGYICESVDKNVAIANRGIRSARFYVLKNTRMPSVLVEAGYLSNKDEELKLKDSAFLDRIASAVTQGILRYKHEYENTEGFTR